MNAQKPNSCPQACESDGPDQNLAAGGDDGLVPVVVNRGEWARRLLGAGRRYAPERDAVAELIAERGMDGSLGHSARYGLTAEEIKIVEDG